MKTTEKPEKPTVVIFRKWKGKDGDVLALFPEIVGDVNGLYCSSYEHVGQHSHADFDLCVSRTRLATPAEYADLKDELTFSIGYDLEVRKRRTNAMRAEFAKHYQDFKDWKASKVEGPIRPVAF